jgi:hypothetical protein
MITLSHLRKIEPALASLSDDEVVLLREDLYGLAELALEIYELEHGSNFAVGSKQVDAHQ